MITDTYVPILKASSIMRKLKVYIADDHSLFRGAMAKLFRDFRRIKEVKEAPNGKVLFDLVKKDVPDVVILDLEMPDWDGAKTCEKIAGEFPEVKIIIVSIHDSKAHINHLLHIGAHAFMSKNGEIEEFEAAIYSVVDKGLYRNKAMEEALRSEAYLGKATIPKKVQLSVQEQKVLRLVFKGLTNKQISYELSLSENTTRNHKVSIMRKAGAKNNAELVKFAYQNGWIDKI